MLDPLAGLFLYSLVFGTPVAIVLLAVSSVRCGMRDDYLGASYRLVALGAIALIFYLVA